MLVQVLYQRELEDLEEARSRKQRRLIDFHYFYFLRQSLAVLLIYHLDYPSCLNLAREFLHL